MGKIVYTKIQYGCIKSHIAEILFGVDWYYPVLVFPNGEIIPVGNGTGFNNETEANQVAYECLELWAKESNVVLEDPAVFN